MRRDGWESRLDAVLASARTRPYELGKHDCFRVACSVVEALTGEDRWPQFAGRYGTRRQAIALIAQYGSSFLQAFDWFFGSDHLDPKFAMRGDIVAISGVDGEKHLGVCIGVSSAFLAPEGMTFVPTLSCVACWRI